ncbi:MAG TPA: YdcF family protein [Actinomycetota bacterium]|nr:YdcF family protein [Actinomycetota bacterium]
MRKLRIVVVIALVLLAYPTWVALQVWQQSRQDELHSADAIVVLGAAQYDGRPSPVFKARLDQAAYLYQESFSHQVIVTGGKRPGDRFTEAEAGRMYLEDQGLPADDILEEDRGETTLQSLKRTRSIARQEQIDSVLFVSDPFHSERIKRMAADLGFDEAYASPASYIQLNRSRETKAKELAREVASILVYELLER